MHSSLYGMCREGIGDECFFVLFALEGISMKSWTGDGSKADI